MKKKQQKSGRSRFNRKKIANLYHESANRVGKHFSDHFVSRIKNIHEVRLWVIEWVLLVVVVFLFTIVQMIWYGDSYKKEAFVKGGDYSEAVLGDINSMNPLYASTNAEKVLARLLFSNLVEPDASGKNKGELAKTVKMDETGKNWTVTLRDDALWSDGEKITSDDVIFTVDLIRDGLAKTTIPVDFSHVKTERVDDMTVKFVLPSTYVDFIDSLEFPIVPKHILGDVNPALVYENEFSTKPIGSGPFVLNAVQASNVTSLNDQTVYLNRNTKYFLTETKLDTFTLKTFSKREDIIEALNSSEVTATAELGAEVSSKMRDNINSRDSLLNGGVYAYFNTKSDKLTKRAVRQAIQRGVNMESVRSGLDNSKFLNYPILASQMDLSYPELAGYDLEAAKKLIQDAGYKYNSEGKIVNDDGNTVSLSAVVQKRDTLTGVAERFVEELKKIGFEVTLNIYDETQTTSDFFSAVIRPRDYDILFYEVDLGVSADPYVYYSSTQASEGGWNFSNYGESLVDDALLSAHTTTDMALRKAKYEYFLKSWVNDVPAIGIYQSSLKYYYNEGADIYSENLHMTDALDRFCDVEHWGTQRAMVNVTP